LTVARFSTDLVLLVWAGGSENCLQNLVTGSARNTAARGTGVELLGCQNEPYRNWLRL